MEFCQANFLTQPCLTVRNMRCQVSNLGNPISTLFLHFTRSKKKIPHSLCERAWAHFQNPITWYARESFSFFSAFSLDFLEMKALFTYVHRKIIFFKKKSKEISSHHKSSTQPLIKANVPPKPPFPLSRRQKSEFLASI